jgi:diaminopimelate epimerase
MLLDITKMNGAGNDFVLLDNRSLKLKLTPDQVQRICHRQRGIGADGIILLVPCASGRADWAWDFYNSDGSKAEMCGNGARCFARYVQRLTGVNRKLDFETLAGIITTEFQGEQVTVHMTPPRDLRLDQSIELKAGPQTVHSVNTGVPHAVLFVQDADQAPVQSWGAELRYHAHFAPRGTNVDFVQVMGSSYIRARTYERGVEGETLACGTGVTASALIAARSHGFSSPIKVKVQGGDILEVNFTVAGTDFTHVKLSGPADFVFEAKMDI